MALCSPRFLLRWLRRSNGGDWLGKARSYEVIEYRKKIMAELCKSEDILKLLDASDIKHPEDMLPFSKIYPHEYGHL